MQGAQARRAEAGSQPPDQGGAEAILTQQRHGNEPLAGMALRDRPLSRQVWADPHAVHPRQAVSGDVVSKVRHIAQDCLLLPPDVACARHKCEFWWELGNCRQLAWCQVHTVRLPPQDASGSIFVARLKAARKNNAGRFRLYRLAFILPYVVLAQKTAGVPAFPQPLEGGA